MSKFFASKVFGVVGASADTAKFGNKVLRWYIDHRLAVIPINPRTPAIEGIDCSKSLSDFADRVPAMSAVSLSIVTPPHISEAVILEAASMGVKCFWLQPGSEPRDYEKLAEDLSVDIIGGGACILVEGEELANVARSKL